MRHRKRSQSPDGSGTLIWGIVGAGAVAIGFWAIQPKHVEPKPKTEFTRIVSPEFAAQAAAPAPVAESETERNRRISVESAAFKAKEIAKLNRALTEKQTLPPAERDKIRDDIGSKQREIDFLKKKYNFTDQDMAAAKTPEPD